MDGSKGGRPRKPESEKLGFQIALRINEVLVERLDRHVKRLQAREPAVVWTRGSGIRALMIQALELAEASDPPSAPAAA